jgi:hypothetical protein
MSYELLRNANVTVTKKLATKSAPIAVITVNDKYTHEFAASSRVSKHLEVMEPEHLEARLNGGAFFFVEDQLVDWRDNSYHGFAHSDDSIKHMMDTIGYVRNKDLPFHRGRGTGDQISLRKTWSKGEIQVPGYQQGGQFTSQLAFTWNPFERMINSQFDLVRLICTNGMVGLTSFLNSKVPLINRWEEHLDIASRQIQNKVNSMVIERVKGMSMERASVADVLLLEQHIANRLEHEDNRSPSTRDRLFNMLNVVAPRQHLSSVYRDGVFSDKSLAAQLPAHISMFDAFNVATELRTHTNETGKSGNAGLDKFANSVLFDREDNFVANGSRYTAPKASAWTDPDEAFIGA